MTILRQIRLFLSSIDQRIYYVLFVLSLLLPNFVLSVVMQAGSTGRLLNVLVMLPVYMLLMLTAKRPGRVYWALIILIALHVFQLVLLTIFSGSVVAVDMILNLFTSEPDEASELLSNILWPIIGYGSLYLLCLILAAFSAWAPSKLSRGFRRRTALSATALLLIALPIYVGAKQHSPYFHLRAEVYPMSVFSNMYLATKKLSEVLHYDQTSADFCFRAQPTHPQEAREVYVLILGETSRAYSWSLYGYPRPTTPKLDSLSRHGSLLAYRDVLTQSNTTYKSIPIILSPADAEHADELPQVKGLLAAFREAGFYTAFITNQPANHSYIDYFAQQGDEYHSLRHSNRRKGPHYDREMLPYLERLLASDHPKLLIVLHSYGSHFSYRDRYPAGDATFPVGKRYSGSARDSLTLRAAYDNAIAETDRFVSSAIGLLERDTTRLSSLVYIADHGEDVYDDSRERFLHSSPDVSYYQMHVPLLLWMSDGYQRRYPRHTQLSRQRLSDPISSNSIFPTMLDLAGIHSPYLRAHHSLVNPAWRVSPRYYLNDRYQSLPVRDIDWTDEDLEMFHRQGIRL